MSDLKDFDLENKVRKLMSQLMEPTIRRTTEDREMLMALRTDVDSVSRKMEETEVIGRNAEYKMSNIDVVK
jgi:hypothetical protein